MGLLRPNNRVDYVTKRHHVGKSVHPAGSKCVAYREDRTLWLHLVFEDGDEAVLKDGWFLLGHEDHGLSVIDQIIYEEDLRVLAALYEAARCT